MRLALKIFFVFLASISFSYAYVSPGNPSGYVNDFANILSVEDKNNFEKILKDFESVTSNEVSVVIIKTFGENETIENYAVKLFEEWKIGKKGKDNGILLLVAIDDRKARIEVGYGLEGVLPDGVADRILRNDILPNFKNGDYGLGIKNGIEKIISATKGEYKVEEKKNNINIYSLPPELVGKFAEIAVLLILMLFSFFARSKSWWHGGVVGAVIGAILGFVSSGGIGILFYILGFAFAGLVLDFVFSKFVGPFSIFGGGGVFGGRSGGGFGGGRSGGGGSSGSW